MRVLLVVKSSKYEWEKKTLNLTHDELMAKYESEKANIKVIMASHERQELAKKWLHNQLGGPVFSLDDFRDTLFRACVPYGPFVESRPDLIVVLGGDNSVTAVLQDSYDVPVITVNSDPQLSVGCLTRWRVDDSNHLFKLMEAINHGKYRMEEWTRLETDRHSTAISEVFVGETKRNDMSRHILEYRGKSYEQKCSGLIVATGCGSTGWYSSVNWHRTVEENKFAPTEKLAKFVITEPSRYSKGCELREGVLEPGEEMVLHSLNDSGGIVSIDTWTELPFARGSSVAIKLGSPAKVVVPL